MSNCNSSNSCVSTKDKQYEKKEVRYSPNIVFIVEQILLENIICLHANQMHNEFRYIQKQ